MDLSRHRRVIVLSVIAVLLQIILAPNLQIGNAVPNFIASFVIAYVLAYAQRPHYVLAFVLGLVADLLGNSAVGLSSLCLLIVAFVEGSAGRVLRSDNLLLSVVVLLIAAFAVDLVYGLFMVGTGVAGFSDAMLYRVLPCTLYDATIAFVWYLILMHRAAPLRVGMRMSADGSSKLHFR